MNMFKKELYDAYLGSMGRKQVIKVKGESGTEYRIVLEPNALPYCSCPSYEYQSFSEIKGCCKHLYKFFYTNSSEQILAYLKFFIIKSFLTKNRFLKYLSNIKF